MKRCLIAKIVFLFLSTCLLLSLPSKLCFDSLNRYYKYTQLCYGNVYLDLAEINQVEQFAVFYGNNASKSANSYIEKVNSIKGVESSHIFNTNTNLITQLFIGVNKLEYETKNEQVGTNVKGEPFIYRKLEVKNADGYQVTNNESLWVDGNLNIGSYEIPEMFVKSNCLKLKDGRYPDFKSSYSTGDIVEIVVTDGLGLKINDECFISLDALDENENLVVLKAKVVGIASKGVFLPYYERYFSEHSSDVSEAYNRVFNGEMIYYTDLSDLYKYNSHFTTEENEVNDNTIVTLILVDNEVASVTAGLLEEFDGKSIAAATGLLGSQENLFSFRYFDGYNDIAFGQDLSIAERELALTICLLIFILIYVIIIVIKIISMIRKYRTTSAIQGDER